MEHLLFITLISLQFTSY